MEKMTDDQTTPPTTWWVWHDALLEEWFYTDVDPSRTPGLLKQLQAEKTTIHHLQAASGVSAIEQLAPGYRQARHQDPVTAPVMRPRRPH